MHIQSRNIVLPLLIAALACASIAQIKSNTPNSRYAATALDNLSSTTPPIINAQNASINSQGLIEWNNRNVPPAMSDTLLVQIKSDTELKLYGGLWLAESEASQAMIYTGKIAGDPTSYVFLRKDGELRSGTLRFLDRVYNLEAIGNHQSRWIEYTDIHDESIDEHEQAHPKTEVNSLPSPIGQNATGGAAPTEIDVFILYSPEYAASFSNYTALDAEIKTRIAESNTIYANSLIDQKIVLLGHRVANDMPDNLTDGTQVGTYASATKVRDSTGADLVSFWNTAGSAGSANNYSGSASACWSTTKKVDIQTRFTFTHELGHNMGGKHDRTTYALAGRTDELGQDRYHFGKWWDTYRTVMSYENCPKSCPRIPHFTNPNVNYNGIPTGIAAGSLDPADNARKLNETKATVAAFRTRLVSPWSAAVSSSNSSSSSNQSSSSNITASLPNPNFAQISSWNKNGFQIQSQGEYQIQIISPDGMIVHQSKGAGNQSISLPKALNSGIWLVQVGTKQGNQNQWILIP